MKLDRIETIEQLNGACDTVIWTADIKEEELEKEILKIIDGLSRVSSKNSEAILSVAKVALAQAKQDDNNLRRRAFHVSVYRWLATVKLGWL